MVKIENYLGTVCVSQDYFSTLVGNAVTTCFGVAGMVFAGSPGLFVDISENRNDFDAGFGDCFCAAGYHDAHVYAF